MQNSLKDQLWAYYCNLPPKISAPIHFLNNNIRNKHTNGQLQRVFMIFSAYVAVHQWKCQYPFVVIVTASHNPPHANGLKLDFMGQCQPVDGHELEEIINHEDKFKAFLEEVDKIKPNRRPVNFFIGRDVRPTSQRLAEIMRYTIAHFSDTWKTMGNSVVDFGEGSTPQIISLSQFVYEKTKKQPQILLEKWTEEYFQEVQVAFRRAVEIIAKHKERQWSKKSVYFDCANGVGSVAFQKYKFLKDFFNITIKFNSDFAQPNVNCGAEWIYHNRTDLSMFHLPQADHYVWFDGDADRILMKLKPDQLLIEGEDFIVCFMQLLRDFLQVLPQKLSIKYVSNILANSGLGPYMQKQNMKGELTPAGINNLFKAAQQYDVCPFFQMNGHGCIYFSQKALELFKQCRQKYWQAQLLLQLHTLSRNNSKGYSLHVFLILQLYFFITGQQKALFFQKEFSINNNYFLKDPELFVNSTQGEKLLESPKQLVSQIAEIIQKNADLVIKLRKSSTEKVIRLSIQGQTQRCKQVLPLLQAVIYKFAEQK